MGLWRCILSALLRISVHCFVDHAENHLCAFARSYALVFFHGCFTHTTHRKSCVQGLRHRPRNENAISQGCLCHSSALTNMKATRCRAILCALLLLALVSTSTGRWPWQRRDREDARRGEDAAPSGRKVHRWPWQRSIGSTDAPSAAGACKGETCGGLEPPSAAACSALGEDDSRTCAAAPLSGPAYDGQWVIDHTERLTPGMHTTLMNNLTKFNQTSERHWEISDLEKKVLSTHTPFAKGLAEQAEELAGPERVRRAGQIARLKNDIKRKRGES